MPARPSLGIWIITTERQPVIHSQRRSAPNDFGFRKLNQRRVNPPRSSSFDSRLRRHLGQSLKARDEFRTAIGVAAVINGIHSSEDVERAERFRPTESERQKDRIPCGDVSDGNLGGHFVERAILGDSDVRSERRSAERTQVQTLHNLTSHLGRFADASRRLEFKTVSLAVVDRQSIGCEALLARDGEHSG